MQITDTVSIVAAAGRNVVANSMVVAAATGEVVAVTEKAVKLQGRTLSGAEISAWFPRKAFKVIGERNLHGSNSRHNTVTLAPWFKPEGWTSRFLELTTTI